MATAGSDSARSTPRTPGWRVTTVACRDRVFGHDGTGEPDGGHPVGADLDGTR